jgi:hypothetical protein
MKQFFNDHQCRLWNHMLQAIANYRSGKIKYPEMVDRLEGALDAGDFQDAELQSRWYDLWTPLEIARATEAYDSSKSDVDQYVSEMQKFLEEILADQ